MKKTEYIEIKRKYTPPEVQLIELEAEGVLEYVSGTGTGDNMGNGDNTPTTDPTNPPVTPPTNPRLSKGITFIDFDDTEE